MQAARDLFLFAVLWHINVSETIAISIVLCTIPTSSNLNHKDFLLPAGIRFRTKAEYAMLVQPASDPHTLVQVSASVHATVSRKEECENRVMMLASYKCKPSIQV